MKRNKYIPTMKYLLTLFLMLATSCLSAQNLINPQLPNVIPPSPTASALMKFEEVPISYYTGLPSIEIPIFSSKMQNGKDMEVKLSYHAANSKIGLIASDCGLGWSLSAGGSISRTVRGLPDEILVRDGVNVGKVGIYQTTLQNHINRTSEYSDLPEEESIGNTFESNEYLWDVGVRGKYDTEHDIYQYNFLGYSGRFIIKKAANGILEISKLDVNPIAIENIYNPDTFEPNSFKITDDEGNQYIFDIIEISGSSQTTNANPRVMGGNYPISTSSEYSFRSSFHLSKIYDVNNILMAELTYSDVQHAEKTRLISTTQYVDKENVIPELTFQYAGTGSFNPLPSSQTSTTNLVVYTKKLAGISIPGKEKVSFVFSKGRLDSKLVDAANSYKLSEIIIKDRLQAIAKKFTFTHSYSDENEIRMVLKQIKEFGNGSAYITRTLEYGQIAAITKYYQANPPFGTTDFTNYGKPIAYVLTEMILPTGGSIKYNFGPSQYSFVGNVPIPITEFDNDIRNWKYELNWQGFTVGGNTKKFLFRINRNQRVWFATTNTFSPNVTNFAYQLYRRDRINGVYIYSDAGSIINFNDPQNNEPLNSLKYKDLTEGEYYVSFDTPNGSVTGEPYFTYGNIGAYFKNRLTDSSGNNVIVSKSHDGEDVRINSIDYFDGLNTSRESFGYSLFSDPSRSSGSIAYPNAVYNTPTTKRECITVATNGGTANIRDIDIVYDAQSTTNQLSVVKTKGFDVGYKNVTTYKQADPENIIGSINEVLVQKKLTYTSPIDYPEDIGEENINYPYMPTVNIDYKRGLLLREELFGEAIGKVKDVEYRYGFEEHIGFTGLRVYNTGNRSFFNHRNHTTYASYLGYLNTCQTCFCSSGYPLSFLTYRHIKEAYGWAKLEEVTTKEYFNYSPITTRTLYEYKPFNQKVGTEVQHLSDGKSIRTEYYYSGDYETWGEPNVADLNSRNAMSTVVKTINFKNDQKISETNIKFKNWGNGMIKAELIRQSKGDESPSTKFKYNDLDSNGNILEMQQESGGKICYIWGYDKTLPVAKIENSIAYRAISSEKIAAIELASSAANFSETSLISALNSLRSESNLENAMITTYTYCRNSLLSTVTDPKGEVTKYSYDSFGNLEFILDKNGNILSETKYHYKNQF